MSSTDSFLARTCCFVLTEEAAAWGRGGDWPVLTHGDVFPRRRALIKNSHQSDNGRKRPEVGTCPLALHPATVSMLTASPLPLTGLKQESWQLRWLPLAGLGSQAKLTKLASSEHVSLCPHPPPIPPRLAMRQQLPRAGLSLGFQSCSQGGESVHNRDARLTCMNSQHSCLSRRLYSSFPLDAALCSRMEKALALLVLFWCKSLLLCSPGQPGSSATFPDLLSLPQAGPVGALLSQPSQR